MEISNVKLARFPAVWCLLMAWVDASGFLTQECQKNYLFSMGNIETYCLDHVCNANVWTSINLNNCIGNEDGILTIEKDGNYEHKCENCMISDDRYHFGCDCLDESMEAHHSEVNLNDILYNWFGWLSCFDQHETAAAHDYFCQPSGWQPDPSTPDETCVDGCPERDGP